MFSSESFLTILKTSDSAEELQAVKEKVDLEIARLRSRDTGDDDGMVSLVYYIYVLDNDAFCQLQVSCIMPSLK